MKRYLIFVAVALTPFFLNAKEKPKELAMPDLSLDKVSFGNVVNEVDIDAKALAGKVVVIELWGVNCAPCIASLPEMQKMARSGESKGLVVVGFEAQNSSKDAILKVLKEARVKYPIMTGANLPLAADGIPHVAVFNTVGKLVWHGHPTDEKFKSAVKAALKEVEKK